MNRKTSGHLAALIIAYPQRMKGTVWRQEAAFAAAGLCGVCLYYLLENIALTYTLASNVGVIISIAPLFHSHPYPSVHERRRKAEGKFLYRICRCNGWYLPDQLKRFQAAA